MEVTHNRSLFSESSSIDEKRTQTGKEFDAKREAEVFANAIIKNNSDVSEFFAKLCAPLKEWTGGHFEVYPTQSILWSKALHRERLDEGISFGTKWTFYVIWPLRHGSSDGHGTNQRIITQIAAEQVTIMKSEASELIVQRDLLHLKFMGFWSATLEKVPNSISSSPFDELFPNIPSKLFPPGNNL